MVSCTNRAKCLCQIRRYNNSAHRCPIALTQGSVETRYSFYKFHGGYTLCKSNASKLFNTLQTLKTPEKFSHSSWRLPANTVRFFERRLQTQPPVDPQFCLVLAGFYCSKQWQRPWSGLNCGLSSGWVMKSPLNIMKVQIYQIFILSFTRKKARTWSLHALIGVSHCLTPC